MISIRHFLEEDIEKLVARRFNPSAFDRGRAGGRDLPIGIKRPEVIETDHVIELAVELQCG
jgi:hypothetical protein